MGKIWGQAPSAQFEFATTLCLFKLPKSVEGVSAPNSGGKQCATNPHVKLAVHSHPGCTKLL